MILECLIKRDGPTIFTLDQKTYHFQPLRRDPSTGKILKGPVTSTAEVTDEKHIDHLLRSGQYRVYEETQEPYAQFRDVVCMDGFAIALHDKKEGYRVEDRRTTPFRYAGRDGQWLENPADLVAFETEFAAYTWLKEEITAGNLEPEPEPEGKKAAKAGAKGAKALDLILEEKGK